MLNYRVESLEGIDENLHSLYEQKDGAYFLKVSGVVSEESVSALKANSEALLAEKREAQRLKDEAKAESTRLALEAQEAEARRSGNLEAIENSWKEKLALRETELTSQLSQAQAKNYELTVGRQAQELAGELAKPNAQRLLAKEIKERLTLDENGNIRVLDLQGKPSALTIDELKAQLRADPTYQDIIIINNSTGGGATGGGQGGGATKNPKEYTTQEMKDLRQSNPELYNQLFPLK